MRRALSWANAPCYLKVSLGILMVEMLIDSLVPSRLEPS